MFHISLCLYEYIYKKKIRLTSLAQILPKDLMYVAIPLGLNVQIKFMILYLFTMFDLQRISSLFKITPKFRRSEGRRGLEEEQEQQQKTN